MLDGFADVVYGTRFTGGKPHRILFYWHTVGNKFITMLSNISGKVISSLKTGIIIDNISVFKKSDSKFNAF